MRVGKVLNWCADHVGDVYFVAMAAACLAAVAVAVVLAAVSGSWMYLLVALGFPAVWLVMWLTD